MIPDEADQWIRDMERIFLFEEVPNREHIDFSEYMLSGEETH